MDRLCHATDGPYKIDPSKISPGPSAAIFLAVGGPHGQCMAATDGLPHH